MAKDPREWKAHAHGALERLNERVWRVEGTLPGMSLRRTMTLARTSDGRLALHSPIALAEPAMKELEALGTPSYLIVPNGYHRLDAPRYKARYPELRVFAPSGSRARVSEVVAVDGAYEDFPHDAHVRLETLPGVGALEGALLVQADDGLTLVLNDIVFNMDQKKDVLGFLFTTLLGSAPGPRISRLAKLALVKDKHALRSELERFAALPELTRVIVAHEKVTSGHEAAAAMLRQAATYL